jgi:hypothetical protein
MRGLAQKADPAPDAKISETLSRARIDMGYRLYWTKMALGWDAERRYRVYDLDEQAHSGASILVCYTP